MGRTRNDGVDYVNKVRPCTAPGHSGDRLLSFDAFYRRRDDREPSSWCKDCTRVAARRRKRLLAGLPPGTRAELLQTSADSWAARAEILEKLGRGCECCGQLDAHYLVWPRNNPGRWLERNGVLCGNCYIARRQWGGCYAVLRNYGKDRGAPFGAAGAIAKDVGPPDGALEDPAHMVPGEGARRGHPDAEPLPARAFVPEPGEVVEAPPTLDDAPAAPMTDAPGAKEDPGLLDPHEPARATIADLERLAGEAPDL